MNKILTLEQLETVLTRDTKHKRTIVLAGGCFDILHPGHIAFLTHAKAAGDTLVIMLEHDAMIAARKGPGKPVNTQEIRGSILATLDAVDYVVPLPPLMTNDAYDKVVLMVKPAIIATTKGDPSINHKERQAKLVDGHVFEVIDRLPEHASSKLAARIQS